MRYCYVAIDNKTGRPVVGGPMKYHLTHPLQQGKIKADEVKFFRIGEARWPHLSKVTELSVEDVLKR